jgi:hypothetical protein
MGAPRFILITSSENTYLPLTLDMVRSVRALALPFVLDIGLVDLGLSDESKAQLAPLGVMIKEAQVDIDYPGRTAWEAQAPYYRALTMRPFLRDYFPGYDAYMHMDADAWAQTPDAIQTMLQAAAQDDALYIASEFDRDYSPYFLSSQPWQFHLKWYLANFPADAVNAIFPRPMLNAGIWAMSPRSHVWQAWADVYSAALRRIPQLTRENFMCDQLSLNMAVYTAGLPVKIMPATFNWMSLYALPMIDAASGFYVRPTPPRDVISILHLTHEKKLREVELRRTDGRTVTRALTYSGFNS